MRERLSLAALFTLFALFFLPSNSAAQTCQTLTRPVVVGSGGVLWTEAKNIISQNDNPLILGTQGGSMGDKDHKSPVGGWVILDLGCFTDSEGVDLEVYEIGKAEGGEVYVGKVDAKTKIAPRSDGILAESGWKYVKQGDTYGEDCGQESLPESGSGCSAGDEWLGLDIGKNDDGQYRYVYLWSDGSPAAESVYGGSSDFDAIRVTSQFSGVGLSVRVSGIAKASVDSVAVGQKTQFSVRVSTELLTEDARYDCAVGSPYFEKGSLDVSSGVVAFDCRYLEIGEYVTSVTVGDVTENMKVSVTPSGPTYDSGGAGDATGQAGMLAEQRVLRGFLWGVVLCLLGYGIFSMTKFTKWGK